MSAWIVVDAAGTRSAALAIFSQTAARPVVKMTRGAFERQRLDFREALHHVRVVASRHDFVIARVV
ncbi:hypothetical protein [Burkholderia pseudomallei]|uniref:hypothetical protein n=1 Tax=Burkholderia pseudomallei TaxID=28450 RepID=UPI000A1A25DA|nr:hypothetical protein [Burkholderia pseudomallei]ARL23921.1 hypothetical protein BOC47_17275 [Burkholderia pseudomallei]